ncbi:MAG: hypothetical protein HQL87_12605 [Magnetococcales bacterium]|nr:hypothetical protein [Magnetococcales bacterium]
MVNLKTNRLPNQPASFVTAEREATASIHHLHSRILEAKALIRNLEGVLCANPYRNKEINRLVCLRDELRKWYTVRRQMSQTRMTKAG